MALSFVGKKLLKFYPSKQFCGFYTRCMTFSAPTCTKVNLVSESRFVKVYWDESNSSEFPSIWLRDNCQCENCYHKSSESRAVRLQTIDSDICPTKVSIGEKDTIEIVWPDNHQSIFEKEWLKNRIFHTDPPVEDDYPIKTLWDSTYINKLKRHNYYDVMTKDSSLLRWLKDLSEYGLTVLEDAPLEKDVVKTVIKKRIGVIRLTHYGEDFEVISKSNANNLAYTNKTLGLHVDLPYYDRMPGVQFLHCIKQTNSKGGSNTFVDGFKVAKDLREKHPKQYDILTRSKVNFWDVGVEKIAGSFYKTNRVPTIQLDSSGKEVIRINYSDQVRDSILKLSPSEALDFYKALKLFNELCYDPSNVILYKMESGDIVNFDNQRVLHGRTSYDEVVEDNLDEVLRHIQGAYVDWDEVYSRINVLQNKIS